MKSSHVFYRVEAKNNPQEFMDFDSYEEAIRHISRAITEGDDIRETHQIVQYTARSNDLIKIEFDERLLVIRGNGRVNVIGAIINPSEQRRHYSR